MSLSSQIRQNVIISLILIFFMFLLIVGVGYFLDVGGEFHGVITTISLGMAIFFSLGSYLYSDKIALSITGAREASYEEFRYLHNATEGVAIAAGIPKPRVYVIDDLSPNAFATGRDPKRSAIAVTTGLLKILDRQELEGVIAHEISHIRNYDILLATIAAVLVGAVVIMRDIVLRMSFRGSSRRRGKGGGNAVVLIVGLILLILAPIFMTLIRLAISRQREFLADSTSALLTRYPEGLVQALEKLEEHKQPMRSSTEAMAHMFIVNPFSKGIDLEGLFSTHPSIASRILRLRSIRGL